jgi:hypothetical protein
MFLGNGGGTFQLNSASRPLRWGCLTSHSVRSSNPGQNLVAVAEAIELLGRRQGQWDILATVEMSSGRQAGQSFVGANKVQDLPVPVEWLAGLVLGDLRKEKNPCSWASIWKRRSNGGPR